jgi:cytoskeletal protein CcmA (bactofilin family)
MRTANITGNLTADNNIEVGGQVTGDLSSDRIHLNSSAKVKGKLSHKNLGLVDEGARLEIECFYKKKISNNRQRIIMFFKSDKKSQDQVDGFSHLGEDLRFEGRK